MKASVVKIAALVLFLTVFCIVALTARWAEKSGYDHINHQSDQADESVPDSAAHWNRVDSISPGTNVTEAEPETENPFLAGWIGRSGNKHDQAELEGLSGDQQSNRLSEESDDGGEPPDDSKDTYGTDNVE